MISRAERWIFTAYSGQLAGLPLVRIVYAITLLWHAPRSFYAREFEAGGRSLLDPPPGPAAWMVALFDGLPPVAVTGALEAGLVLAALCLLVGYLTPIASVACGVLWVLTSLPGFSIGKVDHDILLGVVPLCLAASGWGRELSVDNGVRRRGGLPPTFAEDHGGGRAWTVALLALAVGVSMGFSGVTKAMTGWLDPSRPAVLSKIVDNAAFYGRDAPLTRVFLDYHPRALWEAHDWVTVALECAFGLAWLRPRWIRTLCAVAVFFHAGVYLTMSILFLSNLIAYAPFADWRSIRRRGFVARIWRGLDALSSLGPVAFLAVAVPVALAWGYLGSPLRWVGRATGVYDSPALPVVVCVVAVALAACHLASLVTGRRRGGAAS